MYRATIVFQSSGIHDGFTSVENFPALSNRSGKTEFCGQLGSRDNSVARSVIAYVGVERTVDKMEFKTSWKLHLKGILHCLEMLVSR